MIRFPNWFRKPPRDSSPQAVWARLEAFEFDNPKAAYPYSARLADQQGWTRDFALRVVEEYRRFLFLSVAAGHTAVPSLTVDEAWHLHLQYTRQYVEELCVFTLGRFIHHDPGTGGGTEEKDGFDLLYWETLESYRHFFKEEPPLDIWGPKNGLNVHKLDAANAGRKLDGGSHLRGDSDSLLRTLNG